MATGRIIGLGIAFIGFQYHYIQASFIALAVVMLLFPIALYWNTSLSKKYTYL